MPYSWVNDLLGTLFRGLPLETTTVDFKQSTVQSFSINSTLIKRIFIQIQYLESTSDVCIIFMT